MLFVIFCRRLDAFVSGFGIELGLASISPQFNKKR
jgi:hypothetical protein